MRDFPAAGLAVLRLLSHPALFRRGLRYLSAVWRKFFFFQYRAALFPGGPPVAQVDHPLDERIPFNPRFIRIYLDFVAHWIRAAAFLRTRYGKGAFGKRGVALAGDFIRSTTELYAFALQVYSRHLSTTKRPRYLKNPRFWVIHATDPHLMCVPSLHVMIVVHCYTKFRGLVRDMGEEEALRPLTERLFREALAITEAVLYVKQHSVNCIAAALYTMSRFDSSLFSPAEAERFVSSLFGTPPPPGYAPFYGGARVQEGQIPRIREHIAGLYRSFLEGGGGDWTEPLLGYLRGLPRH
ncbi:MAG: hypothetical protein LBG84_05040 [Treponema sp.]|jgi:hypothetical protein|nr:hypothetical protein [Treponema sp.]